MLQHQMIFTGMTKHIEEKLNVQFSLSKKFYSVEL